MTELWTSLQPNLFRWEDTYRVEDAACRMLETRPHLRSYRLPRAVVLRSLQCIALRLRPMSGDVIHCRLRKA